MPLVDGLFGKLKGATKGYATLNYEDTGSKRSSLVKLQLLVNKKPVDAISRVVHTSQIERLKRQWVNKFKKYRTSLPPYPLHSLLTNSAPLDRHDSN
ncbi:hypothetical protein PG985_005704 [Apiospora marii]|uniref:uncharacterized protein n=1 Tax=Apiospora marii TaxID=335849 RepID=UPI003131A79E